MRLFAQLAQMGRGEVWQASSKSDRLGQELWAWFKGDLSEKRYFAVNLVAVWLFAALCVLPLQGCWEVVGHIPKKTLCEFCDIYRLLEGY